MSENHAADDGSKFAIAVLLFAVTHCVYSVVGRCFEIWQVIRADLYFCLQFMDVNARLLFSGFSTLCVAVLGGYFVRSHRARPNDSVLSQFCREPYKVRAEADAPWGALAAKPLRTRSVPASAPPQSSGRALLPAKDVGVATMTLSVIANSRLRTHLPTIHFVDALENQKTYCHSKGYKVRPLK